MLIVEVCWVWMLGKGHCCPEWSVILKVKQLKIIYKNIFFLCRVEFFIMLGTPLHNTNLMLCSKRLFVLFIFFLSIRKDFMGMQVKGCKHTAILNFPKLKKLLY